MAIIKPFKALRPRPELAARVAALPYDVMNSDEARRLARDNPYSFLHIDKAEIDLAPEVDLYDERVYQQAAANLQKFRQEGILRQDARPYFYIYQLCMAGRRQTGLVVTAAIDDYLNNRIKKHEFTRADKETDRIKHVAACNANTGPIFMTYPFQQEVGQLLQAWMAQNDPIYNFVAADQVEHRGWVIDDEAAIQTLIKQFAAIEALYIADGHHRSASAVQVGLNRRQALPHFTGEEAFNYFLAVLFPHNELQIMDYNRVVKDLHGHTPAEFLQALEKNFVVTKADVAPLRPMAPHFFGMYLGGVWYQLQARPGSFNGGDPVGGLDVSILQENLLGPLLGIKDPRTDERINFVGGIRGLQELERRVDAGSGGGVAFALHPTGIQELMRVADLDRVMPPKSTWFEPKLRSGLFIHSLAEA